jgi:hypothetical protein
LSGCFNLPFSSLFSTLKTYHQIITLTIFCKLASSTCLCATMNELPTSSSPASNDFLVVLEALLKLTSSNSDGSGSSYQSHKAHPICTTQNGTLNPFQSGFSGFVCPLSPAATTALLASSGLAFHSNLLGTAATPAGMILPSTPLNQHQHYSPSQIAAAVSLLSPASSSTSKYALGCQQESAPTVSNNSTNNTSSMSDASGDYSSSQNSVSSTSKATDVRPVSLSPASKSASPLKENRHRNNYLDTVVRQEKVVAALQSKSQRGKRRDDLSEKERMELTRSRNREHAKSTR